MESTSRITALNVLNVIAYVANVLIVYGIGVGGLIDGLPTNAELSEKYQTLITPIGWSFSIWGVIFISQFIFALVQLFAPFRSHPLVVSGVKRTYIGVCLAQIGWTLAFSYEIIWLSLTAMLLILSLLITILMAQYKIVDVTVRDYILLKFPFAIHAGWIVAASFVNGSVLLVDRNTGDELQYYTALGSLLAILLIAALALSISRPEYVVPLVLSWASVGIFFELDNPKDAIVNTFDEADVTNVRNGSLIASGIILVSVVLRFVLGFIRSLRDKDRPNQSRQGQSRNGNDSGYVRTDDDGVPNTTV